MTLLTRYFDELNIGDRWTSAARTIEHTDLIVWKRLTEPEPQTPTSPGSNAHRALRRPAAPSLLVNAFAIGLGMPATRGAILVDYDVEELRFVAPVFVGDTLRLDSEVLDCRERHHGKDGLVTLRWDALNQRNQLVMASRLNCLLASSDRSRA